MDAGVNVAVLVNTLQFLSLPFDYCKYLLPVRSYSGSGFELIWRGGPNSPRYRVVEHVDITWQ